MVAQEEKKKITKTTVSLSPAGHWTVDALNNVHFNKRDV